MLLFAIHLFERPISRIIMPDYGGMSCAIIIHLPFDVSFPSPPQKKYGRQNITVPPPVADGSVHLSKRVSFLISFYLLQKPYHLEIDFHAGIHFDAIVFALHGALLRTLVVA